VFSRPVIKGAVAEGNDFAVLTSHIESQRMGAAVISGLVWARVDIKDKAHKFAKVKESKREILESSTSGAAEIKYKEKQAFTGEEVKGEQWALVWLGGGGGTGETRIFQLTNDLPARVGNAPGFADLAPFGFIDDGDTLGAEGAEIRVYNLVDLRLEASDDFIVAHKIQGKWVFGSWSVTMIKDYGAYQDAHIAKCNQQLSWMEGAPVTDISVNRDNNLLWEMMVCGEWQTWSASLECP
jgi:hypothetical protein